MGLKKLYGDEMLQLALLLSLLRVDPESYLGLDIGPIRMGSLNLHNGSGWHTDAQIVVQRPHFVHPKNLDSLLLNYERDVFEELNSLGGYGGINRGMNDIHAYLLNVEETSGSSSGDDGNVTSPDPPTSEVGSETTGAELTQEVVDWGFLGWMDFDSCFGFRYAERSRVKLLLGTT